MNHYEIVLMIHPDRSDEVGRIISCLKRNVMNANGKVHRLEDWGRRQLAYPISKMHKAHYILMNLEVPKGSIQSIENDLRSDDNIFRKIILRTKRPFSERSPMIKFQDEASSKERT
ncbi:30S ribosomal protein S6 [Candidatus Riesia pediculischaeffi]|uniref:Small ribosomal subunit protein bS6 n=1 Tax=Candidatus Riesia pediculischaeffi PTSU TaxID=1401651 RepID=A0A0C1VJ31_9ENTR|nr:30S ribosomal protein S6 [Candidatus Riesia pediculischaeffi]KIE63820.1 SSU ribosomal protein S6p [Candidatus Riesia pediculischaeffi PTSU]